MKYRNGEELPLTNRMYIAKELSKFYPKIFGGWLSFMTGSAIIAFITELVSGRYLREFEGNMAAGILSALAIMFIIGGLLAGAVKLFMIPDKLKKSILEGDFSWSEGVISEVVTYHNKHTVYVDNVRTQSLTAEDSFSAAVGKKRYIIKTRNGVFATKNI